MANNDTEIGISIKSDAQDAADSIASLDDKLELLEKIMARYKPYMNMFNQLTLGIKRMSEVNTTNFDKALKATETHLNNFNKKMEEIKATTFESTLSSMSMALNDFDRALKKVKKFPQIDLSNFGKLDFSTLKNIDTSAVNKVTQSLIQLRDTNINQTSNAINRLVNSMKVMETLNFNKNMAGNINSQMNSMAETLKGFMDKLAGFNVDGISKLFSSLSKIPKAMQAMEKLDVSKIGQVFSTLTTQIQPFLAQLREASADINNFSNILNKIGRIRNTNGLSGIKKEISGIGKESDKTRKKLSNMLSAGKIYALYNQVRHFGGSFGRMLNKAIDFTEIENYFSRAMGNMRKEAMKFQNQLSDMYGLAMPSMMQAQATFKNQLGSLGGLTDQMSYMLSERLTKMSLDYASLYNTSIEAATTKFQAALSKQVRPIRSQSGYDITQSVLGSTMQEIGINDRKIAQMGEMEKRLLIILTLQQQMARSAAMNDFARTIDQPANQLKVLQQQLSDVGRWISAVFYGVIGNVLPYINGFVMAIKSLIQTFATFLGYELPDSSGQSGNILDSMDDSMGGISSGIDDVNSGLDGTNDKLDSAKKKAKELSGALGIDELHTFGKNEDDSDSGKDKDNGVSAGYIDPRILKALEDMNYLFDGVRMKAQDIKDAILGWVDNIGKIADENIFEPIRRSWDKYGGSILSNIKDTKDNIVHILGGVFDVVGEKWKPFFQAASDLFFSLVDTATLVSDTLTTFFKIVWDSGGKYLLEGIFDLVTAFLDLATSVNDNFVKPIITAVKNTLVPIFGTAIGKILEIIGNLLKVLSGIVKWVADCKPLVIGLGSAFTAMFLTIKITKFIELIQAIRNTGNTMSILKLLLLEHSSIFRSYFEKFGSFKGVMESAKTTYLKFNTVLSSTKAWTVISKGLTGVSGLLSRFGTWLTNSIPVIGSFAGAIVTKIGVAFTWLAANPIVAVIAAIAALTAGIAILASSQKESKYEMEDYSEGIQDNIKKLQGMREELDKTSDSAKDAFDAKNADITVVKDYMEMLKDMSGESGYVDNIGKAEFLVGKINEMLPDTVELTKDGKVTWLQNADAIQKNIEKLEQKARLEAYSELYTKAIKDEIQARQTLAEAESNLNNMLAERSEIMARLSSGQSNDGDGKRIEQLNADIDGTRKTISEANKTIDKSTKAIDTNSDAMKKASNSTDKLEGSYSKLSDSQSKAFNSLGDKLKDVNKQLKENADGTIKLNDAQIKSANEAKESLINSYAERAVEFGKSYDTMVGVLKQQGIVLSKEEDKQLKESYDKLLNSNKEKKAVFSKQSDTLLTMIKDNHKLISDEDQQNYKIMLETLNKHGIDVNSKNSKIYEQMFDICKQSGIDISTEQGRQYALMLNMLQNNGIELNKENTDQYKKMFATAQSYGIDLYGEQGKQYSLAIGLLSKYGVDMTNEQNLQHVARLIKAAADGKKEGTDFINALKKGTGSKNIDPEVARIMENAGIVVKQNKLDVGFDIENPTGRIGNLMKDLTKTFNGNNLLGIGFDIISSGLDMITAKKYATGGFPSVGELFIANEKGPEMLGKMGNRNVVANNNQIVDGIEGGVEGGVTRGIFNAFSMMNKVQNNNGDGRTVIENHIHLDVDGRELAEVIDEVKSKDGFDFGMGRK